LFSTPFWQTTEKKKRGEKGKKEKKNSEENPACLHCSLIYFGGQGRKKKKREFPHS